LFWLRAQEFSNRVTTAAQVWNAEPGASGGVMKAKRSNTVQKVNLELKYCERRGGLWLRPAGGEQICCVACGRKI